MTTLAEWIETEAHAMALGVPHVCAPDDPTPGTAGEHFWKQATTYAIQRFIGYDGAHAALMGHPKTLAAPLTIALMAKTAEEAADLTDPATLIGVRRALDVVLAEHAQRREITLGELLDV